MTIYDAKIALTEKRYKPPVFYFLVEAIVMVTIAMGLVSFFA